MKRREFLAASALSLPVLLTRCDRFSRDPGYPIHVYSDLRTGHGLMDGMGSLKKGREYTTANLIVGGGVAGLSAAWALRDKDYLLAELSGTFGGTSGAVEWDGSLICSGAHYELAYPENYGKEVLFMLEQLDVIYHRNWKKEWTFTDRQYVIGERRKSQCYDHGEFRGNVLPEGRPKEEFEIAVREFDGRLIMPTKMIDPELRQLNDLTFEQYLIDRFDPDPHFIRCMDYHMRDDYGAPASKVSALAGLHYFICRPYYTEVVDLFSPPEGNHYFIRKFLGALESDRLHTDWMVMEIEDRGKDLLVRVLDAKERMVHTVITENVIYAGNKHALKYIYPSAYELFNQNVYAPWLVINLVMKDPLDTYGYWQNEMIVEDETFLGFVDSGMQKGVKKGQRVFTCYYCLPPESREDLVNVEVNKQAIVQKTLNYVKQYTGKDLRSYLLSAHIKVMGHAMPIPGPGYLFRDANDHSNDRIFYAGVDNGRLPLFFEAADSGLSAASRITT